MDHLLKVSVFQVHKGGPINHKKKNGDYKNGGIDKEIYLNTSQNSQNSSIYLNNIKNQVNKAAGDEDMNSLVFVTHKQDALGQWVYTE